MWEHPVVGVSLSLSPSPPTATSLHRQTAFLNSCDLVLLRLRRLWKSLGYSELADKVAPQSSRVKRKKHEQGLSADCKSTKRTLTLT